jgi:RNA polymerase primary sigma factor
VFERLAEAETREQLHVCMQGLDPRDRYVVAARFGLEGRPDQTLEEIGASMKLSRERVRQLEKRALQWLKASDAISMIERENC